MPKIVSKKGEETTPKSYDSYGRIKKRGAPGKPKNPKYHQAIEDLISRGHTQSEIAKSLGRSKQNISDYIRRHNLKGIETQRDRQIQRCKLVKRLIEEGDLLEDISEFAGYNSASSFSVYLLNHPELGRPETRLENKRAGYLLQISEGLIEGLNRTEISMEKNIPQTTVDRYVGAFPALQRFLKKGKMKKSREYKENNSKQLPN